MRNPVSVVTQMHDLCREDLSLVYLEKSLRRTPHVKANQKEIINSVVMEKKRRFLISGAFQTVSEV